MNAEQSLYERLGGSLVLPDLVQRFYARVQSDPQLARYFDAADMIRLGRMQTEFLCRVLGGPCTGPGTSLAQVHRHLGINLHDYQRFMQLLFETLAVYQLSQEECYEVIGRMDRYTDEVVDRSTGAAE